MKKSKILLILSLLVTITACSNDDYVSKRHPEANTNQVEEEQVAEETSLEDNPENQEENSSNEEDLQEENTEGIEGVNYKVNDIVNIRLYPSTDSDIVGEAHPGDEIMVILEADGWSRVNIDGQAGYIKSDLLEEVK